MPAFKLKLFLLPQWALRSLRQPTSEPLMQSTLVLPRRILQTLALVLVLLASSSVQAQTVPLSQAEPGTAHQLSNEEIEAGWLQLFDGETLFGWKAEGDGNFAVIDQTIVVNQGSAPCLLRTTSQFDDYMLSVDFKIDEATNSGVFLRTPPSPTDPTLDCFEVNLAQPSVSPFPTGSVVGRKANPIEVDCSKWHRIEMLMQGDSLTVRVDGNLITELAAQKPLGRGFIGLQYNAGQASFRNVFVCPLFPESSQPENLATWRIGPEPQSISLENVANETRLHSGPGYLESQNEFGDFVLRLQARTHSPGVNSGVFFRCIPGSNLDGYESQINHTLVDSDPTRPADFGTGGIFRRSPARRVVSADQQWFSKTIIAEGHHIAVWVNGQAVCDWSDPRPADDNPRRGSRTASGTMAFQVHDPDTSVSFRSVMVRELMAREK